MGVSLKDKQKIANLERKVARLADALGFVMQKLTSNVPSPIIGGEAKVLTMAELYASHVSAKEKAEKAIRAVEELATVQ